MRALRYIKRSSISRKTGDLCHWTDWSEW